MMDNFRIMTAQAFSIANILKGKIVDDYEQKDKIRYYYIPIYQRKYSWRSNIEVKKLLDDLEYFWKTSKSNKEKSYFLGNVVVKHDEKESINKKECFIVIDGQQRLTTFYLMVLTIYKYGLEKNVENNELNELKNMIFSDVDNNLLKFENNDPSTNALIKIKKHVLDGDEINYDENNYFYNFKYIKENLFKKLTFNEWFEIINRVKLSLILLGKEDDAISIFESINSDGLKLGIADLIKSYFFLLSEKYKFKEENIKLIDDFFIKLSNTFEKKTNSGSSEWDEKNVGLFIISCIQLLSKNAEFIKNDRDVLYRKFKEVISVFCKLDEDDCDNLELKSKIIMRVINKFEKYLKAYDNLTKMKISFEKENIKNNFSEYHIISSKFENYLTMLISLEIMKSDKTNLDEIKKIYELLDLHLINISVSNNSVPKDNKFFISYLNKNMHSITYKTIKDFLIGDGKNSSNIYSWDDFRDGLKVSDFYRRIKPIGKYIFYRIEKNLLSEQKTGTSIEWNSLSIEHIMPQDNSNWLESTYDYDYYKMNLNSIRNLTILTSNVNSSIGKLPWDEKSKKILEKSPFLINKKLIEEIANDSWTMVDFDSSPNFNWYMWIEEQIKKIFDYELMKDIIRYDKKNINFIINEIKNNFKDKKIDAISLLKYTFILNGNRAMNSASVSKKVHKLVEILGKYNLNILEKIKIDLNKVDAKGQYMSERLGTYTKNNNQKREANIPIFYKNNNGEFQILENQWTKILDKLN